MVSRLSSFLFSTHLSRHSGFRWYSSKRVVALTGIQPTGTPHLGNYLGMIRPCIDLQNSGKISTLLILIADLHALTSNVAVPTGSLELASALVACFSNHVNPNVNCSTALFLQSSVYGHSELMWILANCCTLPRLSHLPQWREKSGLADLKQRSELLDVPLPPDSPSNFADSLEVSSSVGLFTYPILQAADVLLYDAELVPVGSDQTTHIELTRDLARSAVARWPRLGDLLHPPTALTLGVSKINSLRNPCKKMSKSDPSTEGTIYITDSPDVIRRKVKRAVTDSLQGISYDTEQRPGVSNLLRILAAIERRELDDVVSEASHWDKTTLKSRVTDALVHHFAPLRSRIQTLMGTPKGIEEVRKQFLQGSVLANHLAAERLRAIKSAIGLGLDVSSDVSDCTSRLNL